VEVGGRILVARLAAALTGCCHCLALRWEAMMVVPGWNMTAAPWAVQWMAPLEWVRYPLCRPLVSAPLVLGSPLASLRRPCDDW